MIIYKLNIKNEWGKYLNLIFKNLNVDLYIWQLEDEEVFKNNNDFLFEKQIYSNEEFWEVLKEPEYYINFAMIKLYENKNKFDKGEWDIYLEIIDCEHVEIRINNDSLINHIEENIKKYTYKKIISY